jgi:hypothetical protein
MIKFVLQQIKENTTFLASYTQAMSMLHNVKLFDFLRLNATPSIVALGANVQVQATQAAWSAGYHQCLDDILTFREKFLDAPAEKVNLKMEFDALNYALTKNDLTKEEVDAIRNNTTPEYPKFAPKPTTANGTAAGDTIKPA